MRIKQLPAKFDFLIKDQDETFRLYVDRSEIGEKVLKSLMGKKDGVDAYGNATEGFYLSSRNKEVGLLSQLYGGNAVFTLVNRYGVEATEEVKATAKQSVQYLLQYLHNNGDCYDLNPLLDSGINNELFVDKGNSYIGAMTWSLSLLTAARVAQRKGLMEFSEEETLQIFKQIRNIIKFFVENVIGTEEKPLGWGYANGCTEPSLFFTYSVVESFADFDDNVLNNSALGADEDLISAINASRGTDQQSEEDKLTNRFQSICFKIGDRAWILFKDVLKTNFFSDNFSENFKIVTKDEILNSSRSSVLFNTLYVIFTMFYSYTNVRNQEESEEIVNSMTLALQLIQNFYDELRTCGKDSIVDRHIIAYDQPHEQIKDFGKLLNDESIQASPFLPMLVKANNLIAYYILEFPQQQMRELFDMMLEMQMDGKDDWLWDKRKFDLLSTERYLESVADFFDYYDKYERNYADKSTTDTQRRKEITVEITPKVEQKVKKTLEAAHKKDIAELRRNVEKDYPIEVAINHRIDSMIENRAMSLICEAIDKIVEYNTASQKQKTVIEQTFTPAQSKLKQCLETLAMSYFADDIRVKSKAANEMSEQKLSEAVKADIDKFISAFVEFIAYNNANMPDDKKMSMADIFRILENK